MKRKYVYTILALPFVVIAIVLAVLPSTTRETFISEFKYRTKLLLGYEEPAPTGEELGLRSEHPEEYGPQPGPDGNIPREEGGGSDDEHAASEDSNVESSDQASDSNEASDSDTN